MKKQLIVIIILLTLLAAFTGTAAAAPLASGSATLISLVYVPGKGPVFTFQVSGHYSKADLKGALHVVGGADFPLYCEQIDSVTVTCTVSKQAAGKEVVLSWGGSTFWAFVPRARAPIGQTQYCYSIWDYWAFTNYEWTDFGPYCQDAPALEGDAIIYTVPDPNGNFESLVIFIEEDISYQCGGTVPYNGPAYYFPFCPN